MLSFSRVASSALLAVALLAPLAACTGIRPVYSDAGLGNKRVKVSYAQPNNRLEQIIYQDLALQLGKSEGGPLVTVSAWAGYPGLTNNTVPAPTNAREAVVYAQLTVTAPDGAVLFSGQRSQSADFVSGAQALSNRQAEEGASRQAAELLADTLRLQIIAALSK
ncbi:MAG: LPS assembly lipoprotein LptE [Devosia sp.]